MTVRDLISALDLQVLTEGDLDLPIENGYCGDLLSWVMGRMPHGSVWFTIMSNRNVLAVAVLAEAPAIVLCEGVVPDEDVLEKAREEELTLLTSPEGAFTLAGRVYAMLGQTK